MPPAPPSASSAPRPLGRRRLAAGLLGGVSAFVAFTVLATQPACATPTRLGPVVKADVGALEASVREVAVPRAWSQNHEALDAVAARLVERLKALGYAPAVQEYGVKALEFRNITAVLGDPTAPRVVIGAHYDSCEALPAADDNASGVAVVLELARLFQAHPPPGTVELAFWPLEEPPFFGTEQMGSFQHAKALKTAGVQVKAMITVETVGYYRSEPGTQHFPIPGATLLWSDRGEDLYVVSDLPNGGLTGRVKAALKAGSPLPVRSITMPAIIPGVDWSDHLSFWRNGYPGVMVTDTAPNRNPNYHEATDTPDTLDYPRLGQVTEGLFEAVWQLAAAR